MAELRARMPYADLTGFDRDRRHSAVSELFTVDLLVRYVRWRLGRADQEVYTTHRRGLVGRN
jgi:hypothetical protein